MKLAQIIKNPILYVWIFVILSYFGIILYTNGQLITYSYHDKKFGISIVTTKNIHPNYIYSKTVPPSEYDDIFILTDYNSIGIYMSYWNNNDPSFEVWVRKRRTDFLDQHRSLELIANEDSIIDNHKAVIFTYDEYCRTCNPNDKQSNIKDPNKRLSREYIIYFDGKGIVYQVMISSDTWPEWQINEIIHSIKIDNRG